MKLVRLETTRQDNGSYDLHFNEVGITPTDLNTINESGIDVAIGKISENSFYYHHLDRDDTRYLIYHKGLLKGHGVNDISNLEKALDVYLKN
ncbi:hypothetical protein [Acinetobacter sp. 243_ASPC]|uniref:hypothetical protein n=1 Tax=Acinetobacter sp. 243_ASPC TaxID=1579345 RepID=UPI00066126DB|nr:hypothetical protein [Acinetobacter sp. 243_ASPC]